MVVLASWHIEVTSVGPHHIEAILKHEAASDGRRPNRAAAGAMRLCPRCASQAARKTTTDSSTPERELMRCLRSKMRCPPLSALYIH
jgi:hypothetical protein